jgi:hypothetical protein
LATVAANTIAMQPAPVPTTTPHSRISCQAACIRVVARAPAATRVSAVITTFRRPKRPIRAAANGPIRPKRTRFTDAAAAIVAFDQPNSSSRGPISTPGVLRNPDAAISVTAVTAKTTQA